MKRCPETLLDDLRAGDIGAMARAISVLEDERTGFDTLVQGIQKIAPSPNVVGFTGPPGAGKSTLINALTHEYRSRGKTVAVIAVDPSSPKSGGAVLGDRIRMTDHIMDSGVYTRSLAARGHLGGVSRATRRIVELLRRSNRDVVIIETVGTGQSEVEIASIADVNLVLNAPGLGDDIQAIKAGLLEIADVMVVNKADLPTARSTANHLMAMLSLRETNTDVPVLMTTATKREGIGELADTVDTLLAKKGAATDGHTLQGMRNMIAEYVGSEVSRKLLSSPPGGLDDILASYKAGEVRFAELTDLAVKALARA